MSDKPSNGGFAPSKEDIAHRQRVGSRSGSAPSFVKDTSTGGSSSKLPLVGLGVSLLLIAGLAGYAYSLQQKLTAVTADVTKLKEQLSINDENANLSVDAIRVILKEQDNEVRKLWDVSNKRNKKWIQENQAAVKSLKKKQGEQYANLSGAKKDIEANEKSISSQTKSIDGIKKDLKAYDGQLADQQILIGGIQEQVEGLPANIGKTLKDQEEALKAMDSTRLQLNRRISELEEELRAMKSPQEEPALVPQQ